MEADNADSSLTPETKERVAATRLGIALDWWAVIVAVVLAILVHFNILPSVSLFK